MVLKAISFLKPHQPYRPPALSGTLADNSGNELKLRFNSFMSEAKSPNAGLPPRRIQEVVKELQLDPESVLPHGHYIAKIPVDELTGRKDQPDGKLILVTAMTPTPEGIGKTTTTIGLADALRRMSKRA